MGIKLVATSGGSVELVPANTASNLTVTVPAVTGTTVLQNASNNLLMNSGYGSDAVAYGCRAWVNFNGQDTVAIRASGNVSSITDNGTGNYTVNFTTAMADANYSTTGTARSSGISNGMTLGTISTATSNVQVNTTSGSANAALDTPEVCVAIFR